MMQMRLPNKSRRAALLISYNRSLTKYFKRNITRKLRVKRKDVIMENTQSMLFKNDSTVTKTSCFRTHFLRASTCVDTSQPLWFFTSVCSSDPKMVFNTIVTLLSFCSITLQDGCATSVLSSTDRVQYWFRTTRFGEEDFHFLSAMHCGRYGFSCMVSCVFRV